MPAMKLSAAFGRLRAGHVYPRRAVGDRIVRRSFQLDSAAHRDPVLVASADGVGTKLKVAFLTGRHDTVGRDLVNHCVNDILVQGARPLFFLDYLATGALDPGRCRTSCAVWRPGCRENGCALLGGETAEMPGFYADGEYDVAGFIVGVGRRDASHRRRGHRRRATSLIGLPSVGAAHQRLFARAPHRASRPAVSTSDARVPSSAAPSAKRCSRRTGRTSSRDQPLLGTGLINGMAHITGGGITDNLPRVSSERRRPQSSIAIVGRAPGVPLAARERWRARDEMLRVFNMGIGMMLSSRPTQSLGARRASDAARPTALPSSATSARRGRRRLRRSVPAPSPRLAVLISGRGSNLQSIIEAIASGTTPCHDRGGRVEPARRPRIWRSAREAGMPRRWCSITRLTRAARRFDPAVVAALKRTTSASSASPASCACSRPLLERFPQPDPEHPSVAAAGVPRRRRAEAGARPRREGHRLHRAPRRRRSSTAGRSSCRPRCRCSTTTRQRRSPRASSSRNTGSTRSPCKRSSSAAGDSRGAGSSSGDTFRLQPEAKVLRQSGTNGGTIRIPLGQPRERTSPAESRMRRSCALMVGQTLGHYKIVELLGKGGMGEAVPRRGCQAATARRAQGPVERPRPRSRSPRPVRARSARGCGTESPQHRHDPLSRGGRRRAVSHA